MKDLKYKALKEKGNGFSLEFDEEGKLLSLKNPEDEYGMNWVNGENWGKIDSLHELSVEVDRRFNEKGNFVETYTFKNDTDFNIYVNDTQLGIYLPLPDYYTDAAICLTKCCNTHLFLAGSSSYIMALRMGKNDINLGIILKEGALKSYSIDRTTSFSGREENISNTRGQFILNPENFNLKSGETYKLSFEYVWFKDKEDFNNILRSEKDFINISANSYVLVDEKDIEFEIEVKTDADSKLEVFREGNKVALTKQDDKYLVKDKITDLGEYVYDIFLNGKKTRASFIAISDLESLAKRRCEYILKNQQCKDTNSYLEGAYLIFDKEEKVQYYSHLNDHNGARERVAMGILFAKYLQNNKNPELEASLDKYVAYILKNIFDEETGEVFNDAPRCNDYIRLYNYPWINLFFLELYNLKKDEAFLDRYYKCAKYFYESGGDRYYAIAMPMYESIQTFKKLGRDKEAKELLDFYESQGKFIIDCGENYPAHEVDYEQSIVAPAAIYMCELYLLTKDEKYKEEAIRQIDRLDLFQGFQADYHMNEVAIRHWDGYWFGKRRCLGDTYPHHWSALSGYTYKRASEFLDKEYYEAKANKSLKAVLSLIHEDGSASCAFVYPAKVNGQKAHFYDPFANDQDWGLYFALKYL